MLLFRFFFCLSILLKKKSCRFCVYHIHLGKSNRVYLWITLVIYLIISELSLDYTSDSTEHFLKNNFNLIIYNTPTY